MVTIEQIDGIFYHWVQSFPYSRRGVFQVINQLSYTFLSLLYLPWLFIRRFDIVVASSPHPFSFYPAFILSRLLKVPLIFEVRDLWPILLLQLGSLSSHHPYILLLKLTEFLAVRFSDHIVSVKPGDVDYFVSQYGIDSSKFTHITNGFLPHHSLEISSNIPSSILRVTNSSSFVIGYIGSLSTYYDLESMLEYATYFSELYDYDLIFVIVGSGPQQSAISDFISTNKLTNVFLYPSVPRVSVIPIIKTFDICYLGLQDLGVHDYGISCNKLYEYMYCAKPILGSYRASHDPVATFDLGHSSSSFYRQVDFIKTLYTQPDQCARFSLNSSLAFQKHFHFDSISTSYFQLFSSLSQS